jgi:hypothetical protein
VSTKYRDLYKAKVKRAIPVTDDERQLFELAWQEKRTDELAQAIVEKLGEQKRAVGAPRKTGGDTELIERLMAKHSGNSKLAKHEFIKVVCSRDKIEKKRASERFRKGLRTVAHKVLET